MRTEKCTAVDRGDSEATKCLEGREGVDVVSIELVLCIVPSLDRCLLLPPRRLCTCPSSSMLRERRRGGRSKWAKTFSQCSSTVYRRNMAPSRVYLDKPSSKSSARLQVGCLTSCLTSTFICLSSILVYHSRERSSVCMVCHEGIACLSILPKSKETPMFRWL